MIEPIYLNQAELARKLGVTQQRISQLVQRGLPLLRDGRVELDLSLRWLKWNLAPSKSRWHDRGVHRLDDLRWGLETRGAGDAA